MKVIQGNIVDQVEQAMTFIERNIRMGAEIKGLRREDQWEYPLDALREALVNAICHRNYTSTANVQVRIFDNRLEIWNPGELPAGMTIDDLRKKHESKPRNRLIKLGYLSPSRFSAQWAPSPTAAGLRPRFVGDGQTRPNVL